jgi:phosphatidylcholine synthase
MALTILIDAVDGALARLADVKTYAPQIDGALLDNIVDYLNYVVTPCFFLLVKPGMLPEEYSIAVISIISLSSAYQFCQNGAKTPDHFFKGFPCYWNIGVFYMCILNTSPMVNALLLSFCSLLIFVPIKYVYPSRLEYITQSKHLKMLMHISSALYGVSSIVLIMSYPNTNTLYLSISLAYILIYFLMSFYFTLKPNKKPKNHG